MNVYINDGKSIPQDETCYIIAKDGIFLKKKLDLIESITPVDKISFLDNIQTFAKINIPKIPEKVFANILAFFREVYNLYSSEAIVLLYYNKKNKNYKIYVPEQEVSSASLSYKANIVIKNYNLIGTIHSHGSMAAFHSATDVSDEDKFDGIHITVGKLNDKEFFDITATVAVNGMRVPVISEDYIEGLKFVEYCNYSTNMFKPSFQVINGEKVYNKSVKTTFSFALTNYSNQITFKKEWLRKVKKKEYKTTQFDFNSYPTYMFDGSKLIKTESKEMEVSECKKYDVCNNCIHRTTKINLEEVKKVKEEDCKNNFNLDYSIFDSEKLWTW